MTEYAHYEIKVFMLLRNGTGKLLFMRNDHKESIIYGYVNPPAGHLEIGENVNDAVRRELEEETGLQEVSDIQVRGLVNVRGFKELPVFMIIVSGLVTDKNEPVAKGEGTAVWLSIKEVQEQKVLEDVQRIIDLEQSTPKDQVFQIATKFENRKLVAFIVGS